jgi:hypothetical protein
LTWSAQSTRHVKSIARKADMDNIDSYAEQQFYPLDEAQTQWLVDVASKVRHLSLNESLTLDEQSLLDVAAHQIVRLTSMTIAGFELFSLWNILAKELEQQMISGIHNAINDGLIIDVTTFPSIEKMIEQIKAENNEL